jgi:hypothetical protein
MLTHPDAGIQAVFTQLEQQRDNALAALSAIGAELTQEKAKSAELEAALIAAAQHQADARLALVPKDAA